MLLRLGKGTQHHPSTKDKTGTDTSVGGVKYKNCINTFQGIYLYVYM